MNAPHPQFQATLNDKYQLSEGRVVLTGSQALVRLMLLQAQRDTLQGLNTGGFVSGYRGSPLGGVDQAFWGANAFLSAANVHFQPGLNEDLAATSVWGTQQTNLFQDAKVNGVFGMWYGKGPGVDRSLDVFKHANAAGTSAHGGVLLVAGDDHAAKSSSLPHQSDHVLKAALMPILFPSNVQEILDLGILGYAMSRYAGVWTGFKLIADVVECSSTVEISPERQRIVLPSDFNMPAGGLNIRWPDPPLDQESRLLDYKLYAALAFCRANRINHTVMDCPQARFGIVASGKAYQDTLQALRDLGLHAAQCKQLGIRVYKVGMVWPLDAHGIRAFAQGLREILVVEEKRQLVEYQIKEELYAWREDVRPKVYGKFDERVAEDGREGGEWSLPQGQWLLPSHNELDPALVAKAIAKRLLGFDLPHDIRHGIQQRLSVIAQREQAVQQSHEPVQRKPYFCSGCPHNTSTKLPEGSRALAGIGCHYMAAWMDRNTHTYTQMGGEGVPWIGQAPFSKTQHVFANLGDGTYFHSGILAIRASVAAQVNITYKILYNDAVAMTGGQPLDGTLSVPQLTRQLAAEGVVHIVIVSDNPDAHHCVQARDPLAPNVNIAHRRELDDIQRQLREVKGTSVLIYEQTCASEKRRRRKRINPETGLPQFPNPAKRVIINPRVCEGCGDCSKESNCLSIEPLPTRWGMKRRINQSTCNKDYSCLEGLCPSLITVENAELLPPNSRVGLDRLQALVQGLPEPEFLIQPNALDRRFCVLLNGVGGTGIVTIGAWLGMAAHLQGLSVLGLDMAGLAQKGGAVFSHLQIAPAADMLASPKIPVGEVDLMIGGDLLTSAAPHTLELLSQDANVLVNQDTPPTADFIHNADWFAPHAQLNDDISHSLRQPNQQYQTLRAQHLAEHLLGDTVFANAMLLGVAWQKGWIPLRADAIHRAIELNAVQVKNNVLAFELGRAFVEKQTDIDALMHSTQQGHPVVLQPETPSGLLSRLEADLVAYQNRAYAQRFLQRMNALRVQFEGMQHTQLWMSLCTSYHRVLAFKDEFEVARLHTDSAWQYSTLANFQPNARLNFHFAPEWLRAGQKGSNTRPEKLKLGAWAMPALKLLASLKILRGTIFNPFRNTQEGQDQRHLLYLFETWLDLMQNNVTMLQYSKTIEDTVMLFNEVKGFGRIRHQKYLSVVSRLEAAIMGQTALEDHDQSRTQVSQAQGNKTL